MSTGSNPLRGHLVTMHNAVRHADRSIGCSSQNQVFPTHNSSTANERLCMHAILNDCMLGVVVVQLTGVSL